MIKITKKGKVKPVIEPDLPVYSLKCDECETEFSCNITDMHTFIRAGDPVKFSTLCPLTGCHNSIWLEDSDVQNKA